MKWEKCKFALRGAATARTGGAITPASARNRAKTFGTSRFDGRDGEFLRDRPGRRRPSAPSLRNLPKRVGELRRSSRASPRRDNAGTKRPTAFRREPNNRPERPLRRRRDNGRTPLQGRRERRRRSRNRVGATLPERLRRPTSRNGGETAKNAPRNRGRKGILGTSVDFGCENGVGGRVDAVSTLVAKC